MSYIMSDEEFFQNAAKIEQDEKNRQYWIAKEKEAIEKFSPPGIEFFKSLIPGQIEPAPEGAPDAISSDLGLIDPVELAVDLTPIGLAAGMGLGALKKVDKALPSPAGFTSKLEDVIRQKMGGKATAQEIGAMVKQAGVKQEELDDIAFEQWLQGTENTLFEKQGRSSLEPSTSVQTPKIPKEDVLGYLKAERPELKQIKYGRTEAEKKLVNEASRNLDKAVNEFKKQQNALNSFLAEKINSYRESTLSKNVTVNLLAKKIRDRFSFLEPNVEFDIANNRLKDLAVPERRSAAWRFLNEDVGLTHPQIEYAQREFHYVQLPASAMPDGAQAMGGYVNSDGDAFYSPGTIIFDLGTNNPRLDKEAILSRLGISKSEYDDLFEKQQKAKRVEREAAEKYEDTLREIPPKERWKRYSLSGHYIGENYREYIYTFQPTDRTRGREIFKAESHWPNVEDPVYHIRAQDLTDKDGDKLLNVDEIQSDIHQYGQKFGYKKREMTEKEQDTLVTVLRENDLLPRDFLIGESEEYGPRLNTKMLLEKAMYLPDEEFAKIQPVFKEAGLAVDLPYKKTWHEQAMRRMIKEALDSGKDGVSWTAGSVQAKRAGQDLGEVTSIAYNPASNHLLAYRGDDNIFNKNVPLQKLSQYVGSDIAKQLKDGAAKQIAERKAWKIAQQKQDDYALKQYGEWLKKNDLSPEGYNDIESAKASVAVLFRSDREKLIQELTSAGLTPIQISGIVTQRIGDPPKMEVIKVPATSESFSGSGMRKFYDEKLLNFARQEAKRLGGTVTQTTVKSSTGEEIPLWKFKFGPKTKEAVKEKGLPLYVLPTAVGLGEVVKEMKKEENTKK